MAFSSWIQKEKERWYKGSRKRRGECVENKSDSQPEDSIDLTVTARSQRQFRCVSLKALLMLNYMHIRWTSPSVAIVSYQSGKSTCIQSGVAVKPCHWASMLNSRCLEWKENPIHQHFLLWHQKRSWRWIESDWSVLWGPATFKPKCIHCKSKT